MAMDIAAARRHLDTHLKRLRMYRGYSWPAMPTEYVGLPNRAAELADVASVTNTLPLSELPEWIAQPLESRLRGVLDDLTEFEKGLDPNMPATEQQMCLQRGASLMHSSSLIETMKDLYFAFAYLGVKGAKLADVKETAALAVTNMEDTRRRWEDMFLKGRSDLDKKNAEAESLIKSLRAAAGEHGVSRFAGTFDELAKAHSEAAKRWLRGAIACGVLAMGVATAFLLFESPKGPIGEFANAYILVSRLIVVGLLVFGCGWCASMFKVRAHLNEINSHRATALKTFTLFVESAQGETGRSQILEACVRTVFAPGLTGLVDSKDEKANNEMIPILQGMVRGG